MMFSQHADMYCHYAFKGSFSPPLVPFLSISPDILPKWNQIQNLIFFWKFSPQMSSYLEAVLTTPEDSDPVIPWDFGEQKSVYWIGAFLQHSLSQWLKNPSCQKLSEEIILQLLRMKALLCLFGAVHFKKVRSLIYNQTTLYFTFIQQ